MWSLLYHDIVFDMIHIMIHTDDLKSLESYDTTLESEDTLIIRTLSYSPKEAV